MEAARRQTKRAETQEEIERLFPLEPESVNTPLQSDPADLSAANLPDLAPTPSESPKTITLPKTPGEQKQLIDLLEGKAKRAQNVATILENSAETVGLSAFKRLYSEACSKSGSLLTNLRLLLVANYSLLTASKLAQGKPGLACLNLVVTGLWGSLVVLNSPGTRSAISDWFNTPGAKSEANQILRKIRGEYKSGEISLEEANELVKSIAKQYREKANHYYNECSQVEELAKNHRSTRRDSLQDELAQQYRLKDRPRVINPGVNLWDSLYQAPNGAALASEMQSHITSALGAETDPQLIGIEKPELLPLNAEILQIQTNSTRADRVSRFRKLANELGHFSAILEQRHKLRGRG